MKILDLQGRDVLTAVPEALPPGRVFQSRLPNVATAIGIVSGTAYFVYLGRTTGAIKPRFVEFYVNSAGSGGQVAEIGLFSSVGGPNKANQTLSKVVTINSLDSLTSVGVKRNSNPGFTTIVAAGTHLWAGIRVAMATSNPGIGGLCMDYGQGLVLATTSAGVLTGTGPWTGSIVSVGSYMNTAIAPDLRVVLD